MRSKFITHCSHCNAQLKAERSHMGRYGRCPHCRREFRLVPKLPTWASRDSQQQQPRFGCNSSNNSWRGILAIRLKAERDGHPSPGKSS